MLGSEVNRVLVLFLYDVLINIFRLNTRKLQEDWLCTFCNEQIEDLCHLFCECCFTQLFWTDFLKDILHGKQVTKNGIFFGTENRKESSLIFSSKKNIYISRFAETITLFHEFKIDIENVKKIDESITKKNEKWTRWN